MKFISKKRMHKINNNLEELKVLIRSDPSFERYFSGINSLFNLYIELGLIPTDIDLVRVGKEK